MELYFDQVAKKRIEVQEQLQALADQGKLDPLIAKSWENYTTYMVEQATQLLHPVAYAIQLRLEHDPTLEHWCAGWGCTANLAMDFDGPMVGIIDLPEVLAAASAMSATVLVDGSDYLSAFLTPSISVASDASPADFPTPSQSLQAFEFTPFLGNVKQTDVEAAVDLAIQDPSSCLPMVQLQTWQYLARGWYPPLKIHWLISPASQWQYSPTWARAIPSKLTGMR